MIERQISPIRQNIGLDILAVTPNMIRETMGQHNEHRTLVQNLNREFGSFVPEYARVDRKSSMLSMIRDAPSIVSRSQEFANGPRFLAPSSKECLSRNSTKTVTKSRISTT